MSDCLDWPLKTCTCLRVCRIQFQASTARPAAQKAVSACAIAAQHLCMPGSSLGRRSARPRATARMQVLDGISAPLLMGCQAKTAKILTNWGVFGLAANEVTSTDTFIICRAWQGAPGGA